MDKPLDVVIELNEILFNKDESYDDNFSLTYENNGIYEMICISNFILWRSDEDDREFIEEINEYECLYQYVKKEYNKLADSFFETKF